MTYDITTRRGDTYKGCNFQIIVNNVPLNLTNAKLKMQVRVNRDILPVITLQIGNGLTVTDAFLGKFRINARKFDVPEYEYLYDIEITFQNGWVKTYIEGKFIVIGLDITHG